MNEQEKLLVEKVLSGDKNAFEPLVRPYRDDILRVACRMTRNLEDAREAAQETLLRAFRYLNRFDTARDFRNWILAIVINEARKIVQKRPLSLPLLDTAATVPADQERRHEDRLLRERLRSCLAGMSLRQREIFTLRDLEDLGIRETARILGCSELSVRVHLSRARKRIKEIMTENIEPRKEAAP